MGKHVVYYEALEVVKHGITNPYSLSISSRVTLASACYGIPKGTLVILIMCGGKGGFIREMKKFIEQGEVSSKV